MRCSPLPLAKVTENSCRILGRCQTAVWNAGTSRGVSSTEHCKEETATHCTTADIAQAPCQVYKRKHRRPMEGSAQYTFQFKSMWENRPCCVTCVEAVQPFRHDLHYLKENDYRERTYQRTWPQCPRRCLVPKKCYYEKLNVPEMEVRPRGQQNPDAKMCLKFHDCMKVEKYEKPCKPNMCKPKTRCVFSEPSCCQKRCTMYPSYSECCAKALVKKRPTECQCLYPAGLCAVNEYLRMMGLLKPDD